MITTVLISSDIKNLNGRIYPKEILSKIADQINSSEIDLYGEFNNTGSAVISLSNVSHKIMNAFVEGNELKADISILDTPKGKLLKDQLSEYVFRPRSFGEFNDDGIVDIDTFQIITIDAVKEDAFKDIINNNIK